MPTSKSLKEVDKSKEPVGPQRYNPLNPNHKKSDFLHANSVGNAVRDEGVSSANVFNTGPGKYEIKGDFEKASKFHMGIKTLGFAGKNMD